jgi:hypothetical protein
MLDRGVFSDFTVKLGAQRIDVLCCESFCGHNYGALRLV